MLVVSMTSKVYEFVYISVYQYIGRTLRSQIDDGSIGGGGESVHSLSYQVSTRLISGSSQLPSGLISGSSQLPSGLISGSTQIAQKLVEGYSHLGVCSSEGDLLRTSTILLAFPGGVYILKGAGLSGTENKVNNLFNER